MKLMIKAATVALGVLALGACNKHTDAAQNVLDNAENVSDNMEATTDNAQNAVMTNAENTAAAIDNAADANASGNASSNSSK